MLKKNWEVNFIYTNVLVPLVVLVLYCISFAYLSSRLLIEGVNFVFAERLWKLGLLLLVGVYLIYFVIIKFKKDDRFTFKYSNEKLLVRDFLLLLLPLTPVVQYILNNQGILHPLDSLFVLVFFVLFSGLYIFVIPLLLGIVGSTRTLMILGLAFVVTVTSMAMLSLFFSWFASGNFWIQVMFFGGVFLVTWLLYNLKNKWILHLTIAAVFVTNSATLLTTQLLSYGGGADEPSLPVSENRLLSFVEGGTPAITPNIYLLVYDAYVANETMLAYGIDNRSQEDYLREQGFKLYPHTYSIGADTIESMSKVLNVSNENYGNSRRVVSGDGIVQNIFRYLDYKTYGIFSSDFMFRGNASRYDFTIPENITPSYIQLCSAILTGEFRFDISFNEQPHIQFVETKQRILKGVSGDKVFIYTHSDLPNHSQNSGSCLPDEINLYRARLESANIEMRQDIKTIIDNDPGAIVIIAGDHGPYLTKNCARTTGVYDVSEISRMDIQDRNGAFLAIKWPTEDFARYDDIAVLQDLFPAIFAYLYSDESILESKIDPVIPFSNLQGLFPAIIEPVIQFSNTISGASVDNGIIQGGINDGEALFLSDE